MKCPNCNHENFDGASFCTECGNSLGSSLTCTNCGANLNEDTRFCPHCGYSLKEEPKEIQEEIPEPPIAPRNIEFKCAFFVTGTDSRPGVLTLQPGGISFKSKGFISAFMGKVNYTLPMQNIVSIVHMGPIVMFVDDENNTYPMNSGKVFGGGEIVTDIAYAVELYRRMFWMYAVGKYPNYPQLPYFENIKPEIDLNNISTEELIARVNKL